MNDKRDEFQGLFYTNTGVKRFDTEKLSDDVWKWVVKNFDMKMGSVQAEVNGKWVTAKYEPYYPGFISKIKCFFGLHNYFVSPTLRGTKECFKCGKRKVGLKHY